MKNKTIEIPFGAKDSELKGWEYTIPEGMEAEIKDGKIIVKQKESEDERIRTRLIALVEAFGQGTYKDEMLAYLERQKEQKPIFKKGDKVIWQDEEFNILDVNGDSYNVGGYILPFYRQNELSLIEQKPAEWSEEDERMRQDVIKFIETGWTDNGKSHLIPWLKSLHPQPKKQIPIVKVWKPSEDQIQVIYNVLKSKWGCVTDRACLLGLVNDLKKL